MIDLEFDYSSVPTIKKFEESKAFIRGLMGPFGSGKSSGCVMDLIQWGQMQKKPKGGKRRSRFAVIRNTYPQLKDTTIRTFMDWIPDTSFGSYNKSDHTFMIDRLENDLEIEILFRALDRPEHVSNLLSLELTGAWVNEAREVPYAIIKALQGRVDRFPARKSGGAVRPGIIMDTNPPDDESWWFEMFENTAEELAGKVAVFKQPSGRSPEAENLPNLSPNYYNNLMLGADDEFIKVYVDGMYGFVKEGKPIYPDYNDSQHCRTIEATKGTVIQRGWDFGLTPACVFTQVNPDGRWLILDELVAEDLGIDKFSDVVLLHSSEKWAGYKFEDYADPAGEQRSQTDSRTCFEVMQGKDINVVGSEQDLTLRIESVKKPMNTLSKGLPQLIIHPRCKVLRKGFQGRYQYKKMKIAGSAERFHDKPDKNEYSHPHDALQYVAVKVFGNAVRSRDSKRKQAIKYDNRGIV